VGLGLATPSNLLLFTFLIGAAGASAVPAWQAVVPRLVPKGDLPAAIAANSVGVDISRALGPALGGATIPSFGIVAPFWMNAISNLGIVGTLLWWREAKAPRTLLPAERFGQAVTAGLRYTRHNLHLRGTLMRAVGFFRSPAPIGRCCRCRPRADRGRTATLWRAPWRHRRQRGRRRILAAMTKGEARG
jgi:MFS family permease